MHAINNDPVVWRLGLGAEGFFALLHFLCVAVTPSSLTLKVK